MKLFKNVLLMLIVLLPGAHLIADKALSEVSSTASALVTELIKAVVKGDTKAVRALIAAGADVNAVSHDMERADERDTTALMLAAQRSNVDIVQALIAAGANVNATEGMWKTTPLMEAAHGKSAYTHEGDCDIVIALIVAGADVNAANFAGTTALMIAAERNNIHTVRVLIAAGADINATNDLGKTALDLAKGIDSPHYKGVINAIEDPQEDLNDQMVYAAQFGNADTVKALIAAGADINATYRYENACYSGYMGYHGAWEGDTALILAAKHGRADTVNVLIAAGVNIDAADDRNYHGTALIVASDNGHICIVKALIAAGANVNAVNKYGQTALRFASGRYPNIVKALIAAGANINAGE